MPFSSRPAHAVEARDYASSAPEQHDDPHRAETEAGGEYSSKASKMKGKGRSEDEHTQDMLAAESVPVPLDGLEPLMSYLSSLEDRPCTLLDLALALSYASYPSNDVNQLDVSSAGPSVRKRAPIRIWSSNAFSRLMHDREWIIDCLTVRSQAIMREFLLDLSTGDNFPASIKLEFIIPGSSSEFSAPKEHNIVLVDFSIGRVKNADLPKAIRIRYPKGLAVLTGSPRKELESLYVASSALSRSRNDSQTGLSNLSRKSRPRTPGSGSPLIQQSSPPTQHIAREPKPKSRYVHKATIAELTAFAFETFKRQPALIADTQAGKCFLEFPWHETSLGALSNWPAHYFGYVTMALSVPTAMIIGLGPDRIQIYNDGYIEIAGEFHPRGFGKPGAAAWGSIWADSVGPVVTKVIEERKSFSKADHLVWQQPGHLRHGVDPKGKGAVQVLDEASLLLLETYHTFSYSPLTSNNGVDVDGYVALDIETTDSVVARRRLATARDLQLALAPATSMKQLYASALKVLETNPVDLPFVLLYSVHVFKAGQEMQLNKNTESGTSLLDPHTITDEASQNSERFSGSLLLRLQASCGVPDERHSTYSHFVIDTASEDSIGGTSEPLPFPFLDAILSGDPVHTFLNEEVASQFLFRSWQSITKRAVVCPIQIDSRKIPDMVMVVGLNSRRIYKDIYKSWLEELSRCMRSGLVSAQKVAREQRLLRNLRKLDEAKTSFFTGVSHELRTPLTLIRGPAADALNEPGLSPTNRGRFALISKASNRLLRLVNSLLDFASVDAGRLQTNFQPVYLARYVEDIASLFRSAVERAGLRYKVDIQAKDEVIYTDPACVEKIIYNLISNALKYTSYGTIFVRCFSREEDMVLEIEDTGLGIPANQIDDIFKRFHRVSNPSAAAIEGTGIGLALTKELSKVIYSDLTVESQTPAEEGGTGGGSTFRLVLKKGYSHLPGDAVKLERLPVAASEASHGFIRRGIADEMMDAFTGNDQEGDYAAEGAASVEDDTTSAGDTAADVLINREANILVVDDHDDLRNYIISILGGICRSVTGVSDGEAALRILRTNARIDLVVSDIMMPKMDGFQLLHAIRSDRTLAMMPVILLSARAGAEVTAEGLELGATDYLPKPFASKELIARVRNALSNAKNSRRLEALVEERTAELAASERRAERLMSILPVGVFEATIDGYVVYTNETFRRMCDMHDREAFYLDDWYRKVRAEDRTRVNDVFTKALSTGGEVHTEETFIVDWQFDHVQPDGSRIQCFCQLYPTGNSFVGVLTDITPSVRLAEQALKHEKQRSHDAISLARSQESFLDVVSHELRNPLSAILNCADLCTANHETIATLLDQIGQSLSEDEDMQQLMDDLRIELDEAAESIQGIIASARHQSLIAGDILSVSKFNRGLLTVTPIDICLSRELRTILSMFEMQTRATSISLELRLSKEIRQDLCVCADPTRLTQILVNLISNSCRILENYDGFRRCVVECHALVVEPSLSIFQKSTDEGLAQLSKEKYLPGDAPNGTEMWLLVLVRDSGPGISNETQAHLFTKFNQAQGSNGSMGATRSAVGGGAGLGLYLAKKLAEMMGGSMTVKSVLGHGADFIFYVKTTKTKYVENKDNSKSRVRAPKLAQRALGQAMSSRSSFSTVGSGGDSSSSNVDLLRTASPMAVESRNGGLLSPPINNRNHFRVLVCEDNLLNQKLLHRQLTKVGIETIVANNGLEAIDKLLHSAKEGRPLNVCLMDLEMPVCGGIEAAKRIRALEREGELPGNLVIWAVTGNARGQHAEECKEAGMDSTIVKPYDFKEMLAKLDSLQLA